MFGGDGIATYVTVMMLVVSVLLNVVLWGNERVDKRADKTMFDTIIVHDTITVIKPTVICERVLKVDTVWLERADNMEDSGENQPFSGEDFTADSVQVAIPITERTYEDSTYKAVVRGYKPELVSLDMYNSTRTITITNTKQPKVVVGIGPYTGFGNKGFSYGIAVNVSMPIWSW